MVMLIIGHALWANDAKVVDNRIHTRRSQFGRSCVLAGPKIWEQYKADGYLIASKLSLFHCGRTSTMGAEMRRQMKTTAAGDVIRTTLAVISGKHLRFDWEAEACKHCRHLCMSNCKSFVDNVNC